eukprot:gene46986-57538_t
MINTLHPRGNPPPPCTVNQASLSPSADRHTDGAAALRVALAGMAALAAAWGLGIPWARIRKGLATFQSDAASVPGRFNLMNLRGATVIADYGHNPDAMRALVQAVDALPGKRRSVVISGAGDRRDQDIRQQTEILGDALDEVVLYQDQCQRGRADGEVLALLRQGLANARRTTVTKEVFGEFLAIDTALATLKEGDLCLILIDQIDSQEFTKDFL